MGGIEPPQLAPKTSILPLNYIPIIILDKLTAMLISILRVYPIVLIKKHTRILEPSSKQKDLELQ
jgi:hypothetical protein